MNLAEYLTKRSDTDPPSVDGVLVYAPWLSRDRSAHWARVIADDARNGRYTATRMWAIAEEIVTERDEEEAL